MATLLRCTLLSFSFLLLVISASGLKLVNSTRQYLDRNICQVEAKTLHFQLEGCTTISRPVPVCRGLCPTFSTVQSRYPTTQEYCGSCKPINRPQLRKIRLVFQCEDKVERTHTMNYYKVKQCGCRR